MHADPASPDTIVAVSSPPGRSLRGLIRTSGPATDKVLAKLVLHPPGKPHQLVPVRLRSPQIPALMMLFRAPASYTGEDAAELQVPGNAALLERLLHQAAAIEGVRLAQPGEFTFRAYTAGKLDLTQAEGVAATISATSDSQLRAASLLRKGRLGNVARRLVDDLGTALALVEAGIDFTDQEDVVAIGPRDLSARLSAIAEQINDLLSRSRSWGTLEALPRVVLVGLPSSGKSTLFNALLGHERAVIDAGSGTTRDVLEEPLKLIADDGQRSEVMLVDIAGLDDVLKASPLIDRDSQQAATDAIARADLIVRVTAPGQPVIQTPQSAAVVIDVRTMLDLALDLADTDSVSISLSAHTGEGLAPLRQAIRRHVGQLAVSLGGDVLALQPRHEQGLRQAADHLAVAHGILAEHLDERHLPAIEVLAGELREALDALAALGGQLTPDDVIGRVFSTFCVGK